MTRGVPRRVVILDDDPTGTQTASDVAVVLDPSIETIREAMEGEGGPFFVLTNTRALPETKATRHLCTIVECLRAVATERGEELVPVLRGDSTLRGHVFAEIGVIESSRSVTLFVPAFPEGGRITRDGVHYILTNGEEIPVVETEFARDATFGYQSLKLTDWVAEVGDGRVGVSLALGELRSRGPAFVAAVLAGAPDHSTVIPDAENLEDLRIVLEGLKLVEDGGRDVVIRSAATFAAMRAGIQGRSVQSIEIPNDGRVIVICGSHTSAATSQLDALIERYGMPVVEVPSFAVEGDASAREAGEVAGADVAHALESARCVILRTPRVVAATAGDLRSGMHMMSGLIRAARHVRSLVAGVIAKGGITSARVSTDVFDSRLARVVGQLEAGVPLWRLYLQNPDEDIPYVVVPGNVGDRETLARVVAAFGFQEWPTG